MSLATTKIPKGGDGLQPTRGPVDRSIDIRKAASMGITFAAGGALLGGAVGGAIGGLIGAITVGVAGVFIGAVYHHG